MTSLKFTQNIKFVFYRVRLKTLWVKQKMMVIGISSFSTIILTLSQASPGFYVIENTMGKGEIARHKQFLHFPTVFSASFENFLPISSNLKL